MSESAKRTLAMDERRAGLSTQERERLAGRPHGAPEMDFRTSALAFAWLLLICIMIAGAALIARYSAEPESTNVLPPVESPRVDTPPTERIESQGYGVTSPANISEREPFEESSRLE